MNKKKEKEKCQALTGTYNPCKRFVFGNEKYCDTHKEWKKFTGEEINKIKNGNAKKCSHCTQLHLDETHKFCPICQEKMKKEGIKKRKEMVRCKGIRKKDGNPCKKRPINDTIYCKDHDYMVNYTKEQLNNLKKCSGCGRNILINEGCKQCQDCLERGKENREKHKETKIICKGNVNGEPCKYEAKENGYCGKHQHLGKNIEKEKDETIKLCIEERSGCENTLKVNDPYSRCEPCRIKKRENDKKRRANKNLEANNIIIVDNDKINDMDYNKENNKINNELMDNNKINDHINQNLIDNNKVNDNINNELIDDKDKSENPKNHVKKIGKRKKQNNNPTDNKPDNLEQNSNNMINISDDDEDININDTDEYISENKIISNESINYEKLPDDNKVKMKLCIKCNDYYTLDKFITSKGTMSNKCNVVCLPKERERERKRDRSGRDYKTYEKKPERIEKKQQWREDNQEKCSAYYMKHRQKQIEEDIDAYHEKNAKYAKEYREKNKEKQQEINEKKKADIQQKYNYYKRTADYKNIEWQLSEDDAFTYFNNKCYYCDSHNKLNGIDRMKNYDCYKKENCVSCCDTCNTMKHDYFDEDEFIDACEHILTNLGFILGQRHNKLFIDFSSCDYNAYKSRANKQNIVFELTENEFYSIVNNKCYLCGKSNSSEHNNGIDRIDSKTGYSVANCRACCGNCNYFKNDYSLLVIVKKMLYIVNKHKNFKIGNVDKYLEEYHILYENLLELNNIDMNIDIAKIKQQRYTVKKVRQNYENTLREKYGNIDIRKLKIIQKMTQLNKSNKINLIVDKKSKKTKQELHKIQQERKQKKDEQLKQKHTDENIKTRVKELVEQKKK